MPDTAAQPQAPRIAIKFGASSARSEPSSSRTNRSRQPPSALGKRQRQNALHQDSESGDDDETVGKHEAVTTIGTDTTSGGSDVPVSKRRNKEFVIGSQKNKDWKADLKTRRQERATPSHLSSMNDHTVEFAPADQDKDTTWGLNVSKKPSQGEPSSPGDKTEKQKRNSDATTPTPRSPKDADKDAMDALLGKRRSVQHLVIKNTAITSKPQFSEERAYQRGIQEASEVSTIDEYGEIPDGEFGAAMLRGMGWKGEEFGAKPKEVKRRPHLMGLGSKEDEEIRQGEVDKRHGYRERRPRLNEYRRDREKEKQEQNRRYRDSYKSERDRERREHSHDHRYRDRHYERDDHDRR
ncbi:hypothetical protein F4861DRAFT_226104 [Xylaria intraflava]|nr:hypothetical protein F4861DRAFT_226104 [Xylaria intraflava]